MPRRLAVLLLATLAVVACEGGSDGAAPPPRTFVLSVEGDGFLLVRGETDMFYARSGRFRVEDGTLATADGLPLEGWRVDAAGTVLSNGPVGDLPLPDDAAGVTYAIASDGMVTVARRGRPPEDIGQVAVATFAEPQWLQPVGDARHRPTVASGAASVGAPGIAGRGTITSEDAP